MAEKNIGLIMGVAREKKPFFFTELDTKRFIYMQTNILKYRVLKNLFLSDEFKAAKINTVIHLAFRSQPAYRDEKLHKLNVEGTKRLVEKCIDHEHITKFIFKSSDIVYKLTYQNPVYLDEEADLNFDTDVI